ncbi:DNA-3-methyladenine glycosylase 2 family protein [Pseudoflavitalea sp. G-6-1-2]|uniref:DNA-3-methyladenine glycosylase family protein n=1 Tax=Pseudoflavitalea sp. G-6-1-2 TaxID=2728841 RepID=UPI00146A452A|nr:DNA-3-methyladenine glycosylase 2 family protein [Pseudoflavitalea sp. G-6-1-2]NML20281.1 DNA-3-methyladenine glycosylase 2 family protein [Pseudoflavitalea sp. G-6-1-2]
MKELMTIEKPALFSFRECLWFLDRGYDDCLFRIHDQQLTRFILLDGKPILFRISDAGNSLAVHLLHGSVSDHQLPLLRNHIMDWFDMNKDLSPFYALLQRDKKLQYMPKDFEGLRLISITDLFEALCWSIIGQQINLTFAYKLKRRLVEAFGTALTYEDHTYHLFPSPEKLRSLSVEDLRPLQYSQSKAKYLIGIAQAFAEKKLSYEMLAALKDFNAMQQALIAHKGIGVWTANYVLMKTMRVPNAIPYGDVGLLKALETHEIIKERNETEKIERFFKKYKGWEAYLVFYLWRSLAPPVFQTK